MTAGESCQSGRLAIEFPGFFENPLLDSPAVFVQLVQVGRQRRSPLCVFRRQQLDGQPCLPEASGRIDPRSQREGNLVRFDRRLVAQLGHVQEGLEPGRRLFDQAFETVFDDESVLSPKRYDVGHSADRRQSHGPHEERTHLRGGFFSVTQPLANPPGELERDADSAQIAEGIARAGQPRMHKARRLRQGGTDLMMVGDHKLQAQFAGQGRLGKAADTAIHADQEALRIFLVELPDGVAVEPVSLFQARRDVEVDATSRQFDAVPQQGRGRHAVDVVISVNRDAALRTDGRNDPIGGFRDSRQNFRVVQAGELGVQEAHSPGPRGRGRSAPAP